ncbi:MAG: DUF5666 domain-containing protein [candidate division KSB1 bacterium]|nr:DUF5666 domain-containing protein [candidate division KSB1 bacterium]MDZ7369239.1 DUF5666 domain-containing protein [candidate division KSB1 bacterium]MDZ7407227.1 DUF5666 domain-containing protein [candidate division KSB1 bacterium]
MGEIIGFNTLKIGQRVKVKGKADKSGNFLALEVSVKPPDEQVAIEGKVQSLDLQKNTLHVLNREFALTNGVEIKNVQRQSIALKDLKVGDVVKLKGTFAAAEGFRPLKVKLQESKGFSIEELQGDITQIDPATKTLHVLGIPVVASEKTEIEGFDHRPDRRDRGDRPDRSQRPDRPDRPRLM